MNIYVTVVGKLVGKTTIPPMAITKENYFGIIIKRQDFSIVIGPGQSGK